jgi:hypothetical protein
MEHERTGIDVTFDFRSDTPPGQDPDAGSPLLRQYHKRLWSKALPSGAMFELVDTTSRVYLHHRSELGEFRLTSDAVVPTFRKEPRLRSLLETIPEAVASFSAIGYTIGGMMLFPGNRVDRRMTINAARGCHPRVKDRFDLTVECVRRYYRDEDSPLRPTLARYGDFFRLFGDFRGYVVFFLLQDLVTEDFSAVRFFAPFKEFQSWPVPEDRAAYLAYRERAVGFLQARNRRISASADPVSDQHLAGSARA